MKMRMFWVLMLMLAGAVPGRALDMEVVLHEDAMTTANGGVVPKLTAFTVSPVDGAIFYYDSATSDSYGGGIRKVTSEGDISMYASNAQLTAAAGTTVTLMNDLACDSTGRLFALNDDCLFRIPSVNTVDRMTTMSVMDLGGPRSAIGVDEVHDRVIILGASYSIFAAPKGGIYAISAEANDGTEELLISVTDLHDVYGLDVCSDCVIDAQGALLLLCTSGDVGVHRMSFDATGQVDTVTVVVDNATFGQAIDLGHINYTASVELSSYGQIVVCAYDIYSNPPQMKMVRFTSSGDSWIELATVQQLTALVDGSEALYPPVNQVSINVYLNIAFLAMTPQNELYFMNSGYYLTSQVDKSYIVKLTGDEVPVELSGVWME